MRYRINEVYLLSAVVALIVAGALVLGADLFPAPVRVSETGLLKWLGAALLLWLFSALLRTAIRRER